jgi:hypothetical protein
MALGKLVEERIDARQLTFSFSLGDLFHYINTHHMNNIQWSIDKLC